MNTLLLFLLIIAILIYHWMVWTITNQLDCIKNILADLQSRLPNRLNIKFGSDEPIPSTKNINKK